MGDDAQPFCAALARGCRLDAGTGARARGAPKLLQGGQSCARCQPRVDGTSRAAALHAKPIPARYFPRRGVHVQGRRASGAPTCASIDGLVGLSQPECVAYARLHSLEYLGTQREPTEFGGCVVWQRRTVEFNEFVGGVGCNVRAKGGECICARREGTVVA